MLGLGDAWVFSVYLLCILSAVVCLVYGFISWKGDVEAAEDADAAQWAEKEINIEKPL